MPPQQSSGSSLHCHPYGRQCSRWAPPGMHIAPPTPSPGGPCSSGDPPCKTVGEQSREEGEAWQQMQERLGNVSWSNGAGVSTFNVIFSL